MTTMTAHHDRPRLDVWLAAERDITRHAAQTLIAAGCVTINGKSTRAGQRVREQDVVAVSDDPSAVAAWGDSGYAVGTPSASSRLGSRRGDHRGSETPRHPPAPPPPHGLSSLSLRIVYEDDALAVVDKPAGMVVHPAAGHRSGTLVDALRARGTTWSLLGGAERAGIVHRLDRGTSGLLVVAKTEAAHRALAQQLKERMLRRTYWAAVHGGFREETGTVDAPIGRDRRDRKRMAVLDEGRPAVTDFRVVERLGDVSVLEVSLRTGRTHQIRVHMAYIKHPIAGDAVYGRSGEPPWRPALHAARLAFAHPESGESRTFESPLPDDLVAYLDSIRNRRR
ncbi:MAG: RluA family pseudouridine synthase [Candidatus Dormibacteraeota bacterium]|nr:RluA family pseudouridine synthase [Candidatus Dormibacteraeota bacterium]